MNFDQTASRNWSNKRDLIILFFYSERVLEVDGYCSFSWLDQGLAEEVGDQS